MPARAKDARSRLQRMALELFAERGYDRTTATQIAARAGVTERTSFRHFPDKREVLFDGEATLRAALTASIAEAPADLDPLATLFRALQAMVPALEDNRSFAEPRQALVAATPALRERELTKHAALAEALADALRARGVAPRKATLAAQAGMAAFVHATNAWLDEPEPGLCERIDSAHDDLRELLS